MVNSRQMVLKSDSPPDPRILYQCAAYLAAGLDRKKILAKRYGKER